VLNVRIAIYAIALNEEPNIKRFLDSCADADTIIVAETRGLAIPISEGSIANDFRHALGRPYYQASLAARHLGRLTDAYALAVEATSREPDNVRFRHHLQALGTP
jgi:hypothetical protein